MKKPELLAPAGSMKSLIGAINAGCDAVYFGGRKFGARAFAENFGNDEIQTLITFAHLRGVRVYVTINTLVFDDEFQEVLAYADFLVQNKVDAIIVQDLGVLATFTKRYPDTPIHASTQTNTHTIDEARFLKSLGVRRIILARETSLETIRLIKQAVDIELETFVHGALCMSYSGNCLMSSMIGERSGNRGECAQPCRLPYTLLKDGNIVSEAAYLMSAKDLSTLSRVDELVEAGLDSLKIEGRMRKSEYVVAAVRSYREAIDGLLDPDQLQKRADELARTFNRGFTEGYLFGAKPYTLNNAYRPNHQGVEIGQVTAFNRGKVTIRLSDSIALQDGIRFLGGEDYGTSVSRILLGGVAVSSAPGDCEVVLDLPVSVPVGAMVVKTTDVTLEAELSQYLEADFPRIALQGLARIVVGELPKLILAAGGVRIEVLGDDIVQAAKSQALLRQDIQDKLGKLGGTPYHFESLDVVTDNLSFMPVKFLNELRRRGIALWEEARLQSYPQGRILDQKIATGSAGRDLPLSIANCLTQDQIQAVYQAGIRTIYYDEILTVDPSLYPNATLYPIRKRIWPSPDHYGAMQGFVANEFGSFFNPQNRDIIADTFLNVTNIHTAALLFQHHAKAVTLSAELHEEQVLPFAKRFETEFSFIPNLEMVVYGRVDLMITKYCPVAKTLGTNKTHCHLCEHAEYALKDRMGYVYPLHNDGECNMRLLHHRPLNLLSQVRTMKEAGIHRFRADFTVESKATTFEIALALQSAVAGTSFEMPEGEFTAGRYRK